MPRQRTAAEQFKEHEKFMAKRDRFNKKAKKLKEGKIDIYVPTGIDVADRAYEDVVALMHGEQVLMRMANQYWTYADQSMNVAHHYASCVHRNIETKLNNLNTATTPLIASFKEMVLEIGRTRRDLTQSKKDEPVEETNKEEPKEEDNITVLKRILREGPLSPEEARRRGDITLFNHLYGIFGESYEVATQIKGWHPETIQVSAQTALLAFEVGHQVGLRVGQDIDIHGDIKG